MSTWNGRHGPLLIAEIGGNHEGNFDLARRYTELAIGTEADAVKFQIYTADSIVNPSESPDRHAHFKKFELLPEQHIELAKMCRDAGKLYMASVWDLTAFEWIDEYLSIYKIGSGDMTAYPFLREHARRRKPMVVSTGLSSHQEVLDMVGYLQGLDEYYRDPEHLALLQCTSMYPIPNSDANLRVMQSLREATGLAVGYSDHTEGSRALVLAAALGADVLEFHFTDSREGKVFRDHKVSLTPSEVADLVAQIEMDRELLGDGIKQLLPSEVENDHPRTFRRALYPARDLKKGEIVTADDLVCRRPNHGLDPRDEALVIGKPAPRDYKALEKIDPKEWGNS